MYSLQKKQAESIHIKLNLATCCPVSTQGNRLFATGLLWTPTVNRSSNMPRPPQHFILVKSYNLHSRVLLMQCSSLEANTEKQSLHLNSSGVLQTVEQAFGCTWRAEHPVVSQQLFEKAMLQTCSTCEENSRGIIYASTTMRINHMFCFFKDCHVPDIDWRKTIIRSD